ncbi:MAG: 3'-5' exonuclease [Candidatus Gastranaerophilaceae bacterium]|jgi:DNA polymerase III epsilon subunit-like protein
MITIQPINLNKPNISQPLGSTNSSSYCASSVETKITLEKPSSTNLIAYTVPFTSSKSHHFVGETKKVKGKEYQGAGLYKPAKDGNPSYYIDWKNKVGWEHLKNEPINWKTATKKEIQAFWYALALAEANDSAWTKKFNPQNVAQPLAVYRSIISTDAKKAFVKNLEELSELQKQNKEIKQLLDTPIVSKEGKLNFPFTVFDTETTGVNLPVEPCELDAIENPSMHNTIDEQKPSKIIEIGAIKFDNNGKIIPNTGVNQLIDPECHIPEAASNVHGIKDEDVKGKPTMAEILRSFEQNYLGKDIIVAYNSKFDMTLLNHSIREFNKCSPAQPLEQKKRSLVIDPFTLISRIHPYLGSRKKLGEQYKFLFGQDLKGAHDAFADVKGTADVLKYCLYSLDKKAKENGKTLTLRDVLYFQNGYCTPNIGIKLDKRGLNAEKIFAKSYENENIGVEEFQKGYKLTKETANELRSAIGPNNFEILTAGKIIGKTITEDNVKDDDFNEELIGRGKVVNRTYIIEKTFKEVLLNTGVDGYNGKTREEIIDLITDKSKNYIKQEAIDMWMKNADPAKVSEGNDLPDIDVARKVMLEHIEEDKNCKNTKPKDLKDVSGV